MIKKNKVNVIVVLFVGFLFGFFVFANLNIEGLVDNANLIMQKIVLRSDISTSKADRITLDGKTGNISISGDIKINDGGKLDLSDGSEFVLPPGGLSNRSIMGEDIMKNTIDADNIIKNSINNDLIKDNSITSIKIKNKTIISDDILDETIVNSNIANNTISSEKIDTTKPFDLDTKLFAMKGVQFEDFDQKCNLKAEGLIRYNKQLKSIQVCNGDKWNLVGDTTTGQNQDITSHHFAEKTSIGNDDNTALLYHFDVSFNDYSKSSLHGNPHGVEIDTKNKKFGNGSAYFDGKLTNYIGVPDKPENKWNFGYQDFTIDFWLKTNNDARRGVLHSPYGADGNGWNYWAVVVEQNGNINSYFKGPQLKTGKINDGNWHHIAFVRNGDNWYSFLDGKKINKLESNNLCADYPLNGYELILGNNRQLNNAYKGWIDEFRISKGVARWVTDFNPPNSEYK